MRQRGPESVLCSRKTAVAALVLFVQNAGLDSLYAI
jgi:hypothetical protein